MKKIIVFIMLITFLVGCAVTTDNYVNIGKLKSSKLIATGFDEPDITVVITDKGIYMLNGACSFDYDKEIILPKSKIKGY